MAVRMYSRRLFSKLSSHLKFVSCVRNYSGKEVSPFSDDHLVQPSKTIDIFAFLHREDLTWQEVKILYKWRKEQQMREQQRLIPERSKHLGPDIAVAHFIACEGGKVKFHDSDAWLTYESVLKEDMPSSFVPKMYLEAIDASDTNLCYEGFENFTYLPYVKEIILRSCPYIDDWCLHRLKMFEGSLENLDLSGCPNVSDKGICTLHTLKSLKVLNLSNTPKIENKELACLLLQDVLPDLKIIGVDYSDPSLWKRLEEYVN